MLAFAQIGAVIAPAATAYLIELTGWRLVFVVYAVVGLAWAVGFWLWFRDDPAEHRGVNEAELATIRADAPPVTEPSRGRCRGRRCSFNRGVIVLSLHHDPRSILHLLLLHLVPDVLEREARGVPERRSRMVHICSLSVDRAVGMLIGGWLADRISRHSIDPIRDRRYLCLGAFLTAAACLFIGIRCDDLPRRSPSSGRWLCRHAHPVAELVVGHHPTGRAAHRDHLRPHERYRRARGDGIARVRRRVRGLSGANAGTEGPRGVGSDLRCVSSCVLVLGGLSWWLYRFTPLPEPPLAPIPEDAP